MKRSQLLDILIGKILYIQHERPLLVAIDGRDAAGKTILAKEFANRLRERGAVVIESSTDWFHNAQLVRYRRGRESSEGYYHDSFNIDALKQFLLDPLKTGNMCYKAKVFDYRKDKSIISPFIKADPNSILVFEGIFVLRPELREYWDYSVYLYINEEESLRRRIVRIPENEKEIRRLYTVRYIAGQRIYNTESDPMKYANIVIDNNDPENPKIIDESFRTRVNPK
jgi:uridine kinase